VVGIVGPNGGGKTTLLNAILGNIPITHGTIRLFGEDVHNFHAFERIGYVAQTAIQFDPIFPATVEEIVSLGCIRRSRLGRRLTKDDKKAVDNAIHLVGLEPYKKRKISQLSGGRNSAFSSPRRWSRDRTCSYWMRRRPDWTSASRTSSCG